jgi:DNA polymerase-3 subunit epsilon
MNLNLKNPLVFLDLETTGMNIVTDRIVEIALIKVYPDGREEEKQYRINPEMPIPEHVSKIHGIYDEDIKDKPTFKEVAKTIAQFMEGCDFAGFNSNRFDIPLLAEEFLRADVDMDLKKRKFIDVQAIFHKMESVHWLQHTSSTVRNLWKMHTAPWPIPKRHMKCLKRSLMCTEMRNMTTDMVKFQNRL